MSEALGASERPDGRRERCDNSDCHALSPRTQVTDSWRKTIYRCPHCKQILNIDWHTEGNDVQ